MTLRVNCKMATVGTRHGRISTAATLLMLVGLTGLVVTLLWPATLEPVENAVEQRWLAQRADDAALPVTQVDSELVFVAGQSQAEPNPPSVAASPDSPPPSSARPEPITPPPPLFRRCPIARQIWSKLHEHPE